MKDREQLEAAQLERVAAANPEARDRITGRFYRTCRGGVARDGSLTDCGHRARYGVTGFGSFGLMRGDIRYCLRHARAAVRRLNRPLRGRAGRYEVVGEAER